MSPTPGGRPAQTYAVVVCGIALVALLIGLGAWLGTPHSQPSPDAAGDPTTSAPARATKPSRTAADSPDTSDRTAPTRLEIPAIGVDQRLLRLGLDEHGELEVPSMAQAGLPGWYRYSPTPGDPGPSVIAGHVDSDRGPAVFYRLRDLGRGDTVRVHRADGRVADFTVVRTRLVEKGRFPVRQVYGPISHPGLRLITCGGLYDRAKGGYQENLVVFARLSHPLRVA